MTLIRILAVCLLTTTLGACAIAQEKQARDAAALKEFEQFAGPPIKRIHTFTKIHRWRSFNDESVAIWIGTNRAYLLTLRRPCFDLHRQLVIGIAGSNGFIDAKFDHIEFGQMKCRIDEIRELDEKARKAAQRVAAN